MVTSASDIGGTGDLRQRLKRMGTWTLYAFAGSQVLRLISNLILTRLLFPEAFGLMAIITSMLVGVAMLTDLGLSQSIVAHQHGGDVEFMNTAWTLQIIKGFIIAAALLAASGMAAEHFKQPDLPHLMAIVALSSVVSGFGSTKRALVSRNLTHARRQVAVDLSSQAIGLCVTALLAYLHPTPASLAWGGVAGALLGVATSHTLFPGPANRLALNPDALRQIAKLGSIVVITSSVTFMTGEGSKLLMASLVDVKTVGLVGLAASFSGLVAGVSMTIAGKVMMPAYAEVARSGDQARLKRVVERFRLMQIVPGWLYAVGILVLSRPIIGLLYDHRYADAAIIMQVQALAGMVSILTASYYTLLFAVGKPGRDLYISVAHMFLIWTGMWVGHRLFGELGVVIGGVITQWLLYPVTAVVFGRLGLWTPRIDLPVLGLSTLVTILAAMVIPWSSSPLFR
jgi:O-antigen/teichoic acid export membrane protein